MSTPPCVAIHKVKPLQELTLLPENSTFDHRRWDLYEVALDLVLGPANKLDFTDPRACIDITFLPAPMVGELG